MKAFSWTLILLPTVLLPLTLLFSEEAIGYVFAWSWILCSLASVVWGFSALRKDRRLALACVVVGVINVSLVILLPILLPAKTRGAGPKEAVKRIAAGARISECRAPLAAATAQFLPWP